MPDVLEFDPNRELAFNPNRGPDFDPGRPLQFDPQRDLSFKPDHDLGFGKRGVVFRGFVCPICGLSVTEDQPSCTECGAVFDPKPAAPKVAPPPPGPPAPAHMPPPLPPTRAYPPPPKRVEGQHCVFCGARLAAGEAFCWNCGNRVYAGGR